MPMHDWSKVDPGLQHHFHQQWTVAIRDALNVGMLPADYSALLEPRTAALVPPRSRKNVPLRLNVPFHEPRTRLRIEARANVLQKRANRVAIRHRSGEVVCIIEIVSPGNKSTPSAFRSFVAKTHEFLEAGVNVLVVDPFPPGPGDPQSLHKAIWDEFEEMPFEMPAGEPLLLASYRAGDDLAELLPVAFVEPFRVGAEMPDMPAWLDTDSYVPVPLETTYQAAWAVCPADYHYLVEHGKLPEE